MKENTKARLRRHAAVVTMVAAVASTFVARLLMDVFAGWPTAAEWLVSVSLAVIAGAAVGAWLRTPGTGGRTRTVD